VLGNAIKNENVTKALKDEAFDNIISLVKLTDDVVDNLTYHDPNSKIQINIQRVPLCSFS
jgi:hypothetical protein